MEREDKRDDTLVDERTTARETHEREQLLARGMEPLAPEQLEEMRSAGLGARGQMLAAIRMILEREPLKIDDLHYSDRELAGLEALQIAVSGRGRLGEFVYAERRRELLEQALAELQPSLTRGDIRTANATSQLEETLDERHERIADVPNAAHVELDAGEALYDEFVELTEDLGELREQLENLEDAQEEIDASSRAGFTGELEDADKPADKPGDKPADKPAVDPDAPKPATTLTGPERQEPAKPASTLTGPERQEAPKPPSTLTGPERQEPAKPPSTLTGPELIEPAKPPSTLGDASAETDPTKPVKSWWKRPFG